MKYFVLFYTSQCGFFLEAPRGIKTRGALSYTTQCGPFPEVSNHRWLRINELLRPLLYK